MIASYRSASTRTPRPVAFGVVGAADRPRRRGVRSGAYLYDEAMTIASSAVRLLPLDTAEALRRVTAAEPAIAALVEEAVAHRTPARELPSGFAPLHELRSLAHAGREGGSLPAERALRVGIGGPVGSGKSSLVAALCRGLGDTLRIGVVTNDIYTSEDAAFLRRAGVLPDHRITAVETGCCPHTAIRDDITANLEAVAELEAAESLDVILVESGGDNLTAIFSPGLADVQIFVIDVAGGDDIPRKGGPGIARSDLLVINKTDLQRYVGSDLERMRHDSEERRGGRPFLFLSLAEDPAAAPVARWVREQVERFRSGVLLPSADHDHDHHGHSHSHNHSH